MTFDELLKRITPLLPMRSHRRGGQGPVILGPGKIPRLLAVVDTNDLGTDQLVAEYLVLAANLLPEFVAALEDLLGENDQRYHVIIEEYVVAKYARRNFASKKTVLCWHCRKARALLDGVKGT